MKAATLESKFPILSVEHDCIISKDADITVAYRVELPELFTVTIIKSRVYLFQKFSHLRLRFFLFFLDDVPA